MTVFRKQAARYRLRTPLYSGFTVGEFEGLAPERRAAGVMAIAVIDLDAYASPDALLEEAAGVTSKRRQVNRAIARAQKEGYYVKPFPFALHIPDIVAVHQSKDVRNGRPVAGDYYLGDVDALGGAPTAPIALAPPECPEHHWQHWGVFKKEDGHCQGTVRTDERLLAYITLRRQGDSTWYDKIMGHGDHLAAGIMNLLHYEMASQMIAHRPDGLRYLVYHQYSTGGDHALRVWKERALFKPRYLNYVDDRRMALPAQPPMPGLGEGLLALKQTAAMPAFAGAQIANELGVSAAWLRTLHYAWVIERCRSPGLIMDLLRESPEPGVATLRPLSSGMFPVEVLDGVQSVAVVLHGDERGLDTLLPLADAGAKAVRVYHPDPAERAALQALYPPHWTYESLDRIESVPSADVMIVDPPLLSAACYLRDEIAGLISRLEGRLVLGVSQQSLTMLKCERSTPEPFTERFGRMHGRALTCRKMLFRHGEPEEMFWLWLEPA